MRRCSCCNFAATEAGAAWLLQFGTADETKYILETLNGNIPQGLHNPVAIRPAGAGPAGDTSAHTGAPGKGKGKSEVTLHVTGLPLGSTDESLYNFFVQYGDVYSSKILPVSGGGSMEGALRMPEFEGGWCMENLNNFQPENFPGPLSVTYPKDRSDRGKGGMGMSNGSGTGDFFESLAGDPGRSWSAENAWGNGTDLMKSVFSGGKGPWPWDKGAVKGAAQGKELGPKGWGKEKGADKGKSAKSAKTDVGGDAYWGWESDWGGWGKGGKSAKGKGKKPGPY